MAALVCPRYFCFDIFPASVSLIFATDASSWITEVTKFLRILRFVSSTSTTNYRRKINVWINANKHSRPSLQLLGHSLPLPYFFSFSYYFTFPCITSLVSISFITRPFTLTFVSHKILFLNTLLLISLKLIFLLVPLYTSISSSLSLSILTMNGVTLRVDTSSVHLTYSASSQCQFLSVISSLLLLFYFPFASSSHLRRVSYYWSYHLVKH